MTCWVHWQLKQSSNGQERRGACDKYDKNILESMITESKQSDIQMLCTGGNFSEGKQAVHYQKQWKMVWLDKMGFMAFIFSL